MKRILIISIIIKILMLFSVVLILNLIIFSGGADYAFEDTTFIYNDFSNYKEKFENVVSTFADSEHNAYNAIEKDTYPDNEDLDFIFNELGYMRIYLDYDGNVYFQKLGDVLSFRGIVYLKNNGDIIGILKTKAVYIDDSGKWIAYYSHGL